MSDHADWTDRCGGLLRLREAGDGTVEILTASRWFRLEAADLARFTAALYQAAAKRPPVILERPELPTSFGMPVLLGPGISVGRARHGSPVQLRVDDEGLTAERARRLAGYLAAFADDADAATGDGDLSALYGVILDAVTDHAGSSVADESRYQAVARAVLAAGWKPPERET
jgi:hypothetical protein